MDELFGDVIYAYTRKQAIADGVLVDVTERAKEAGFKVQVCLTESLNTFLKNCSEGQSYEGRLWDVLYMGYVAARNAKNQSSFTYKLILLGTDAPSVRELKMMAHGDDEGKLCITIMWPNED